MTLTGSNTFLPSITESSSGNFSKNGLLATVNCVRDAL